MQAEASNPLCSQPPPPPYASLQLPELVSCALEANGKARPGDHPHGGLALADSALAAFAAMARGAGLGLARAHAAGRSDLAKERLLSVRPAQKDTLAEAGLRPPTRARCANRQL